MLYCSLCRENTCLQMLEICLLGKSHIIISCIFALPKPVIFWVRANTRLLRILLILHIFYSQSNVFLKEIFILHILRSFVSSFKSCKLKCLIVYITPVVCICLVWREEYSTSCLWCAERSACNEDHLQGRKVNLLEWNARWNARTTSQAWGCWYKILCHIWSSQSSSLCSSPHYESCPFCLSRMGS